MRAALFCAAMIAASVLPSNADPVTLVIDPGSPYTTTALTGFATFGDQMAGMVITATLPGASTNAATWTVVSSGCGAALGTGWSISQCGDTFETEWTLTSTNAVSALFFDAGPGRVVFDLSTGDFAVTEGSARGLTFDTSFPTPITATYSGPVGLNGSLPAGDLFRFLRLDFTATPFLGTMNFVQDADSLTGDLTPDPVPEPGSWILLTSGLALSAFRRARSRLSARVRLF
jgi:hypothetical protein